MWKNNPARWVKMVRICVLSGVIFSLLLSLRGFTQQLSSAVTSNINVAGNGQSKRVRPVAPTAVIAVPEGFEKLKLSPGCLLEMNVFDVPEMTTELRIDAHGFVTIPLIGPVQLDGTTVPQAQIAIAKLFVEKEILKNPQVTLNVLEFASKNISVLGEVQSPGRIALLAPTPLENVLAMAGGETIEAGNDIEIQHPTINGELTSRHVEYTQGKGQSKLQDVMVDPGDTVLVHRAGIIYVLGAVNRPGGYLMVNGGSLSVIEAIALAGGTTLQASTKWAIVVRRQGNSFTQFKIPLARMEIGKAAASQLQFNDALYVPVSTWKAVLINGSNVLSAATSAAIYRAP